MDIYLTRVFMKQFNLLYDRLHKIQELSYSGATVPLSEEVIPFFEHFEELKKKKSEGKMAPEEEYSFELVFWDPMWRVGKGE